jgi:methyl-accepting chemotaxis protein
MRRANGSHLNDGDQPDSKQLLAALTAFKRGDFSAQLPDDWTGIAGKVADSFNEVIQINQRLTQELARIGRVVGKEGRIRQRASLGEAFGSWADAMRSVNNLIEDLVHPTSEMTRVIGSVAKGDLSQTIATEIEGRALEGSFCVLQKS